MPSRPALKLGHCIRDKRRGKQMMENYAEKCADHRIPFLTKKTSISYHFKWCFPKFFGFSTQHLRVVIGFSPICSTPKKPPNSSDDHLGAAAVGGFRGLPVGLWGLGEAPGGGGCHQCQPRRAWLGVFVHGGHFLWSHPGSPTHFLRHIFKWKTECLEWFLKDWSYFYFVFLWRGVLYRGVFGAYSRKAIHLVGVEQAPNL